MNKKILLTFLYILTHIIISILFINFSFSHGLKTSEKKIVDKMETKFC